MKVTLAYLLPEEREANIIVGELRRLHPSAKVRKSDRHPPFRHIYLTTKGPEKPCNIKGNACKTTTDMV